MFFIELQWSEMELSWSNLLENKACASERSVFRRFLHGLLIRRSWVRVPAISFVSPGKHGTYDNKKKMASRQKWSGDHFGERKFYTIFFDWT